MIVLAFGIAANAQEKKAESKVKHLTYKEFTKKVWDFEKSPNTFVYKGKLPAVIDFYADWCGPCRRVAPIMEKMAEEYDGRLLVYKIDVDQEKELASAFGVKSIPMVEVGEGVQTYSRKADGQKKFSIGGRETNFRICEFSCHDGSDAIKVSGDLVYMLQEIREHFKKPVSIIGPAHP